MPADCVPHTALDAVSLSSVPVAVAKILLRRASCSAIVRPTRSNVELSSTVPSLTACVIAATSLPYPKIALSKLSWSSCLASLPASSRRSSAKDKRKDANCAGSDVSRTRADSTARSTLYRASPGLAASAAETRPPSENTASSRARAAPAKAKRPPLRNPATLSSTLFHRVPPATAAAGGRALSSSRLSSREVAPRRNVARGSICWPVSRSVVASVSNSHIPSASSGYASRQSCTVHSPEAIRSRQVERIRSLSCFIDWSITLYASLAVLRFSGALPAPGVV